MRRESIVLPAEGPIWERVQLDDPGARQTLMRRLAKLDSETGSFTLFHDIAWLLEGEDREPDDVRIFICRDGDELRGYAPFVVQPWRMRFRIGETTLMSILFERLHVNAGPIVTAPDPREGAATLSALFTQLRSNLSHGQVIYLEGVVAGGQVDLAVNCTRTRAAYEVMEPSPRYDRRLIRLPASFEDYLRSMKSQTRQNLRNSQRKLERHAAVKLLRFRQPDQVSDFVQRAVAISRKTYQWRLLGLGLRNSEELERTLAAMASHDYTRCYLLECGGVAAAFMIGYLYRGTYYYVDVGFDPDWESWSVGTVLHMEVLRDLIDEPDRAQVFDFSTGTGVHKKRFGNDARPEAIYVLVPRSLRNRLAITAYHAMNVFSTAVVAVLDRLRLKATIKRLIRRRARSGTSDD